MSPACYRALYGMNDIVLSNYLYQYHQKHLYVICASREAGRMLRDSFSAHVVAAGSPASSLIEPLPQKRVDPLTLAS